MRKGAYSKKYKALEAERILELKSERKSAINYHKGQEKNIIKETNRRRRHIAEKKKSFADIEQVRRQKVLESRRKRQLEATTKFQREPVSKWIKNDDDQNDGIQVLNDGVYNVRGHIVEIKNGSRVSSVVSQSNSQSMRNNSVSQGRNNEAAARSHHGSHSKKSIYSGREYLLNHLSDLNNGNDNNNSLQNVQSVQTGIVPNKPGEATVDVKMNDEKSNGIPSATGRHAAELDATQSIAKKGISKQSSESSLSSADSLEIKSNKKERKGAAIKRKSSLKGSQPPGSPSKEKRKVKFNSSIEFNDGFTWLLKDNEQKPIVRTFDDNVVKKQPIVREEKIFIPETSKKIVTNDLDRLKDYSYPESVDLGLPTKPNLTKEDKRQNVLQKDVEDLKNVNDKQQVVDGKLYDSLDDGEGEDDDEAVRRDSLDLVENEEEKMNFQSAGDRIITDAKAEPLKRETVLNDTSQYIINQNQSEAKQEADLNQKSIINHIGNQIESKSSAPETSGHAIDGIHYEKVFDNKSSRFIPDTTHNHNVGSNAHFSYKGYDAWPNEKDKATGNDTRSYIAMAPSNHSYKAVANPVIDKYYNTLPLTMQSTTNYGSRVSSVHANAEFGNRTNDANIVHHAMRPSDNNGYRSNMEHGFDYVANPTHYYRTLEESNSIHLLNRQYPEYQQSFVPNSELNTPNLRLPTSGDAVPEKSGTTYNGQLRTVSDKTGPVNINDSSKYLRDQSEVLRLHLEAVRDRSHLARNQPKHFRDESKQGETVALQSTTRLHYNTPMMVANAPHSAVQFTSVDPSSRRLQGSHQPSNDPIDPSIDHNIPLNKRGITTNMHDDDGDDDDIIKKVRKSMAELQFSSKWRPPESAVTVKEGHDVTSKENPLEEMPRPNNKAKVMNVEISDEEDKIKMQSKITESPGKKSSIPVRVQSAPTSGAHQLGIGMKTPQKAGIVPHPPKGPKGMFTRKGSRQDSANRRNSPMRVMKPNANGNYGSHRIDTVKVDTYKSEDDDAARLDGRENYSEKELEKTIGERTGQQGSLNLASHGRNLTENSIENKLNKTPTDDEINELWYNVRNCLSTKPPPKASSDSMYIAPPWKQNRTWSGTTRGKSNRRREFGLHTAPNNKQDFPLRRYGSQDNLIRRENSLDNLVGNVNSRGKSALLPQRSVKEKINTNFQAFVTKKPPVYEPNRSSKPPSVSKSNANDMSESLASFLALEVMCQQESLSPQRTSAVLKASQNVYYEAQKDKITTAQRFANTRRQEPSALSIEERRIMESLERLNSRLREKEADARKKEASLAWNQQMSNGILEETKRIDISNAGKVSRTGQTANQSDRHHAAQRY